MVKRRKTSEDAAAPGLSPSGDAAAKPIDPPGIASAYAPALNAGFQATASRVQDMHQAIAGQTFGHLQQVPGLSVPTRIVQGVHDAITQGVYAAVRHGGDTAVSVAAGVQRLVGDAAPGGATEQAVRSALNGVVGDSLAASASALAVQMGLRAGGAPLAVTPEALATLRPRTCVFIHGLACDEHSWGLRSDAWRLSRWAHALPEGQPIDYGALLEHELGVSAIYLRYNTGLAIDANAQQLAALLEQAARAAPQVREWLLIGHSMGGLVARRAHDLASADAMTWPVHVPMIICLGSPHQGAPLEQLGQLATTALNLSDLTRPLGRIAQARSQGIQDLGRGLTDHARPATAPAMRLLFGTLGDESDAVMGPWIGRLLGDGLVMAGSAADDGASGDVQRVELAGLGHMSLLNHPRVYAELRRWLGAADAA